MAEEAHREWLNFLLQQRAWWQAYEAAYAPTDRWHVLRVMYADLMPAIFAAARTHRRGMIHPGMVPWQFSPIEEQAWDYLRCLGMPMYPQIPVAGVFVDFANPYHKIGLELNGADYHDYETDARRDRVLAAQGWRIIRIPGAEFYTANYCIDEWENPEIAYEYASEIQQWMAYSAEGVMTAIDCVYFRTLVRTWPHHDLAREVLNIHCLVHSAQEVH